METTRTVAAKARQALREQGRKFHPSRRQCDWDGIWAVKDAAREAGYALPLERWAGPATSVLALTRAYLSRYACAYGIDASPEPDRAEAEVLHSLAAVLRAR